MKSEFSRKILGIMLYFMLMLMCVPAKVLGAEDVIYVSGSNGNDTNTGTSEAPVKSIERALELVQTDGMIQIVGSTSSSQPGEDEPLIIAKSITIKGGELTLSKAGIMLGADVTFKEVSINFANPVRNAIIANGYILSVENVVGSGTYPVHLFAGSVTGYSGSVTLPLAGSAGTIIISGTNNNLGNIFAGSLAESYVTKDEVFVSGAANVWEGSANIEIAAGAGGTIGNVYAHGATEPRGQGDGAGMTPDSTQYTVTGNATVNLSGSKPAVVYGATGGEKNADVIVSGGEYAIYNLIFDNLASLTVNSGVLQPGGLNENLDLTIQSGAELDLSEVIVDESIFTVKDFNGGGMLSMGLTDKLCITGTVTGETEFQTTENRSNSKITSGKVEEAYTYIDVSMADGEGSFYLQPGIFQRGTTLEKQSTETTSAWVTVCPTEILDAVPASFSIPTTFYTVKSEDMTDGIEVPVNCELAEGEWFVDVPLTITIGKDSGEGIEAEEVYDEYGYSYFVSELGFEGIYGDIAENGWVLLVTSYDAFIEPGTYTITISATLADNSIATETITLIVEKETPEIGTVSANSLTDTLDVSKVILERTNTEIAGILKLKEGTELQYGTHDYTWVFLPTDMETYKEIEGTVSITINDTIAPVITGITDGATYCEKQIITVTDANTLTVRINDEEITLGENDTYELTADGTIYNIVATDGAGLSTSAVVTVNADHTDTDNNGSCDICGVCIDGISARLAGYSLSLEGNIGVNFYMELDESVLSDEMAYMQFTLDGKDVLTVMVSDVKENIAEVNGKTYYVFKYCVPVKDMQTEITAQMVLGDGSKGTLYTYTIEEYANYILDSENGYDGVTIALVNAMLNYGDYAKAYFAGETLAGTEAMTEVTAEVLKKFEKYVMRDFTDIYYGSSLLLKSETILRHYFTEEVEGSTQKGELYYIDIPNIAAHRLHKDVIMDVGEIQIIYSPLSYAYEVLSSEAVEDNLKNLMQAMYLYNEAAKEYAYVHSKEECHILVNYDRCEDIGAVMYRIGDGEYQPLEELNVRYGTVIEIVVEPEDGYTFSRMNINEKIFTINTITYCVEDDIIIYALADKVN